jgi:hypothetical protein
MKAQHFLQVSSAIIGKNRYSDKKMRHHYLCELSNHQDNGSSQLFPFHIRPKDPSSVTDFFRISEAHACVTLIVLGIGKLIEGLSKTGPLIKF